MEFKLIREVYGKVEWSEIECQVAEAMLNTERGMGWTSDVAKEAGVTIEELYQVITARRVPVIKYGSVQVRLIFMDVRNFIQFARIKGSARYSLEFTVASEDGALVPEAQLVAYTKERERLMSYNVDKTYFGYHSDRSDERLHAWKLEVAEDLYAALGLKIS